MDATWAVEYRDGSTLTEFAKDGREVPFRAIEWERATAIRFENEAAQGRFELAQAPEGYRLALGRRTFLTMQGEELAVYLLMVVKGNAAPGPESVASVLYYFPDGTTHDCPHYDCQEVRAAAAQWIRGLPGQLMPMHDVQHVEADAVVA